MLASLLCTAVALLHPYLPTGLAQDFFYSQFPTYRRPDTRSEVIEAELVWQEVQASHSFRPPFSAVLTHLTQTYVQSSKFTLPYLLETACSSAHSVLLRLGSLVAISHLVATNPGSTATMFDQEPATTLSRTIAVIRLGVESPAARLSDDVVLFWLWHGVEEVLARAPSKTLDGELIFNLIDVRPAPTCCDFAFH